ncbi:hypothetical protein, partial [Pseudomonas sp.]|uniref:hypothetical protein n=1 Tax=Pseudomonas sp. TaxID=306 RepID=UPI0037C8F224
GQLYAQVNSSTLQLSLTPPIYRFDKSAQATTSLTPGDPHTMLPASYRAALRSSGYLPCF